MTEQLGAMLVRLRESKGYSQLHLAEKLCEVSAMDTVTRHEVSRWERQERIPSVVWLQWFAAVLEVPLAELEAAVAMTRKGAAAPKPERSLGSRREDQVKVTKAKQAAAPVAARTGSASPAPGNGDDPLSRLTIRFEHRTTSVRLSATFDDPGRAVSAIGTFRSMVGDGEAGGRRAGDGQAVRGGTDPVRVRASPAPQQRTAAPAAAALTADSSGRVPVGIRYTGGPGTRAVGNGREPGR